MRTWTKREMAYKLDCSVSTIEKDMKYLKDKGYSDIIAEVEEGTQIHRYSNNDFELIAQIREHCQDKSNSRDNFVPLTKTEIVKDEPKITKLKSNEINQFSANQNLKLLRQQNPLIEFEILEALQKSYDHKWLLPTKLAATLIGINPASLLNYKTYSYCGFLLTRLNKTSKNIWWEISKNNF